MTASCVDADEGAASRADLWARILIASATEETAHGVFPAVDAVLPLIGKRQRFSSRVVCSAL
jgi:hypothetical protein